MIDFLAPGGEVRSACDGTCDALSAVEQAYLPCYPGGAPASVLLRNATTDLRVFGGGSGGGLVVGDGYSRYRDRSTNVSPNWSVDAVLVLADGRAFVLSDRRHGALGPAAAVGGGIARSVGAIEGISLLAESQLVGRVARTTFRLTSAAALDGATFVFFVDDDLGTAWWDDAASFSGSLAGGDLVLLQSDSVAGGVTTRLTGRAVSGADLALFGAGTFPATSVALEDAGDLSWLSSDGSGFALEAIGGRAAALAFALQGSEAVVETDYELLAP